MKNLTVDLQLRLRHARWGEQARQGKARQNRTMHGVSISECSVIQSRVSVRNDCSRNERARLKMRKRDISDCLTQTLTYDLFFVLHLPHMSQNRGYVRTAVNSLFCTDNLVSVLVYLRQHVINRSTALSHYSIDCLTYIPWLLALITQHPKSIPVHLHTISCCNC